MRMIYLRNTMRFQLTPARGRKLFMSAGTGKKSGFQLTPARGRKHRPAYKTSSYFVHFNSPPRGDENIIQHHKPRDKPAFQLTPARGRKLNSANVRPTMTYFNSPPRGDENFSISAIISSVEFQLTPARGRKLAARFARGARADISTHPREGTKT